MKKIFKKIKLRDLVLIITGLIIGGGIGITATTYVLQANEIEYKNNKSVQEAIEELYTMAQNGGGSTETLTIGSSTAKGYKITVPYTGSYATIGCMYGTTESYGNVGTIDGNTYTFIGTAGNQTLYYKIVATDNNGKIYENSGSAVTGTEQNLITTGLPAGVKAIVYLDPTDLSRYCGESTSIRTSGTIKGCMKWYAFKEDNTSYTMILDHNTYAQGTWEDTKSALTTLQSQTGWKNLNTRMITGQEVADITENTSWSPTSSSFSLDPNCYTSTCTNKYYWLFDYISGCTNYGCKVAADTNSHNSGYWTSTPSSSGYAWFMPFQGLFTTAQVSAKYYGLRPVITVQKSNF